MLCGVSSAPTGGRGSCVGIEGDREPAGHRGAPGGRRHAGRAGGAGRAPRPTRSCSTWTSAAWRTRECRARRCRTLLAGRPRPPVRGRPPGRPHRGDHRGHRRASPRPTSSPWSPDSRCGWPGLPEFVPVIEHLLSVDDRAAIARFLHAAAARRPGAVGPPARSQRPRRRARARRPQLTGDHRDHRLVRRGTRR